MEYRIVIYGFDSGLNELLNGVYYDYRTRRVFNREKNKNDALIIKHLRKEFKNVHLNTPIRMHYKFFVKDKRHDRMNIASAFDKSFLDALQKVGMLHNDGFDDVTEFLFEWEVDRQNPRVEVIVTELADSEENRQKSINCQGTLKKPRG